MKLIFTGNSIVNGFPWKRSESFPGIIRVVMNSNEFKSSVPGGANTKFEVINKGVNGDNTTGIMARLGTDVISHRPDFAFFLTGANDFIYKLNSPEGCFENLLEIAARCKENSITPVLCTPLPLDAEQASTGWYVEGADYITVSEQLSELSSVILNRSHEHGIASVNLHEPYLNYNKFYDGLHPDKEGQKLLALTLLDWIRKNLQ